MRNLGLPWTQDQTLRGPGRSRKTPGKSANTVNGQINVTPSRGRPRKSSENGGETGVEESAKRTTGLPTTFTAVNREEFGVGVSAKKPRGRPRKMKEEDVEMSFVEQPEKRGRGRPRKSTERS